MAEEIKNINHIGGINTYSNPFEVPDGNVIHCVNMQSFPYGAKTTRPGYITYLNEVDSEKVNSLFSWTKNDGSTLKTFRASGSSLYYSAQGTADWVKCSGGTITNGAHVDNAVLENVLSVTGGTLRYSADGITLTDTPSCPTGAEFLAVYQGRLWTTGTASDIFYSTIGTASDFTTDSSSILIDGAGKVQRIFKASDRLITTKNSLIMQRYDGETLVDMATELGPSSPYSVGKVEDFRLWLNRLGIFVSNGGVPELVSNAIRRQIYNDDNTGIAGTTFNTAPGEVHRYQYFLSAGTLTDDFVRESISDTIIVYDYQMNEFFNFKFANFPTSYHSYKDENGIQQLIFGDSAGKCYQMSGTATSDNGTAIDSSLILMVHGDLPHERKDFRKLIVYTNPGCSLKCQVAFENTSYSRMAEKGISGPKIWTEIGDLRKGENVFSLPPSSRGNFMYIRIYGASSVTRSSVYSIKYSYNLALL